jgi:hypothetical protein
MELASLARSTIHVISSVQGLHCQNTTHTSRLNSFNSSAVTPFGSSVADLMRETEDTSPSGSFR